MAQGIAVYCFDIARGVVLAMPLRALARFHFPQSLAIATHRCEALPRLGSGGLRVLWAQRRPDTIATGGRTWEDRRHTCFTRPMASRPEAWGSPSMRSTNWAAAGFSTRRPPTRTGGRPSPPQRCRVGGWGYEILFLIGEYFCAKAGRLTGPSLFEDVPVRFAIADAGAHYHVPLLVSPWCYTTYRLS